MDEIGPRRKYGTRERMPSESIHAEDDDNDEIIIYKMSGISV